MKYLILINGINQIKGAQAAPSDALLLVYFLHLKAPKAKKSPAEEKAPAEKTKEGEANKGEEPVEEAPTDKAKEGETNKSEEPVAKTQEKPAPNEEPAKPGEDGKAYEKGIKEPTPEELAAIKASRIKIAEDFYKKYNPGIDADAIASQINRIDFSKPVRLVKVPPDGAGPKGNELYQFTKYNSEGKPLRGQYYTDNPTCSPTELGISDKYTVKDGSWKPTNEVRTVIQEKIVFEEKQVEGLKSVAREINDTWSLNNLSIPTKGGGSQIYIPKNQ